MMRCITAICPAGPPKLKAATRIQTLMASEKETPCEGVGVVAAVWVRGVAISVSPFAGLTEIGIEGIERLRAACDALVVVGGCHGDAGDQARDAGGLLAAVLGVLEIDVVDDLGDGSERCVFQAAALQQHLEGAAVALMRVLGIEHVEAQFP